MTKPTVGAVVCTYSDSGHLTETIRRVYNAVDCILILIGTTPWSCSDPNRDNLATYNTATQLFDPEQKITVISKRWATETEQRAYGKDVLHKRGIEWCMILDDDEFYNPDQLAEFIPKLNRADDVYIYLVPMHIYWKSRDYVFPNANTSYPVFVRTDPEKTEFTVARAANVLGGNWVSTTHSELAMHHLSYVRTDEQVQKKVARFSHADQFGHDWFKAWAGWQPTQDAELESGTVHKVQRLETPLIKPCGYVKESKLEHLLRELSSTVESDQAFKGLRDKPEFIVKLIKLMPVLAGDFKVYLHEEIPKILGSLGPETPYVHLAKWEILIVESI